MANLVCDQYPFGAFIPISDTISETMWLGVLCLIKLIQLIKGKRKCRFRLSIVLQGSTIDSELEKKLNERLQNLQLHVELNWMLVEVSAFRDNS